MTALRVVAGILVAIGGAWAVGAVALRLVLGRVEGERADAERDRWGRLSFSFLLGIASLAFWMVGLSLAGVAWSLPLVGAPALAALAARAWIHRAGFGHRKEERQKRRARRPESFPLADRASRWILAGAAMVCVLGSLRERIVEVDAVAAWALHAKVFFLERTACPRFLTSGAAGGDILHWPPLVALSQAWGHLAMGAYDDRLVKLLFPVFYIAMLGCAWSALRSAWDPASAGTLLVPLATVPALVVPFPAGSVASAYADVPLAAFIAGSAAALLRWEGGRSLRWLAVAAFLSAAALWVKREGLAFAGVAVLAVGSLALADRRGTRAARIGPLLLFAVVVAASLAAQVLYKSRFPGPFAGEKLDPAFLMTAEGFAELGQNLRGLALEAIHPTRWGILWILLAVVAVVRLRRFRERPAALVGLLLAGQILATLIGMTLSGFSPERMARLDMRRVLLHAAPLAALAIGLLAEPDQRRTRREDPRPAPDGSGCGRPP